MLEIHVPAARIAIIRLCMFQLMYMGLARHFRKMYLILINRFIIQVNLKVSHRNTAGVPFCQVVLVPHEMDPLVGAKARHFLDRLTESNLLCL